MGTSLYPNLHNRDQTNKNNKKINPGILNKKFLTEAFNLQSYLLRGINLTDNDNLSVYSPLEFWGNDLDSLKNDTNVIKSINKKSINNNLSLFSGIIKVNGMIKSADALRIILLYKEQYPTDNGDLNSPNPGKIWDLNLEKFKSLQNTDERFNLFLIKDNENTAPDETNGHTFYLKLTKMNSIDHFILTVCYLFISIYSIISISHLNTVKSKIGLFVALFVEVLLSLLSSATIISYAFKNESFFKIPLQILPFIVIVVATENTIRLINSTIKTPEESSTFFRISKALSKSGIHSTLIVLTNLFILLIIQPFLVSNTKKFCLFVSIALIIDHLLHLTFFTAVLSIDITRSELVDLLNQKNTSKLGFLSRFFNIKGYNSNKKRNDLFSLETDSKGVPFLKKFYKNFKLPIQTTISSYTVISLFLIGTNLRWSMDSINFPNDLMNTSSLTAVLPTLPTTNNGINKEKLENDLSLFLDKKSFNDEIFKLLNIKNSNSIKTLIHIFNPNIGFFSKFNIPMKFLPNDEEYFFNSSFIYKFDIYYLLEFLASLVFVLSMSLIIFDFFTKNLSINDEQSLFDGNENYQLIKQKNNDYDHQQNSFHIKLLNDGHFLDIIKIKTSNSPFIVSVGLDHKVLVWSPISQPIPKPTQLPIPQEMWPITNVVLSDNSNFIAIFSRTGIIKCWSRLAMTWIWKIRIDELFNSNPLESFFRIKTIPAFLKRKMNNGLQDDLTGTNNNHSRRNSMRSITSPTLNPTFIFANTGGISNNIDEELVIVLKNGEVLNISVENGEIKREKITTSSIVSSIKLISPRVNDRLISTTVTGQLIVSTCVNNKWKSRTVNVDYKRFNNPETDAVGLNEIKRIQNYNNIKFNKLNDVQINNTLTIEEEFSKSAIAVVPFVGMIVRTRGLTAELVDVSTGILIKKFAIKPFKKSSFKVFHDQPTHCRFCGSVSISSFSVAYTLLNTNKVIMHTFNVDHRAKTSICLRVERDPREIRCVGFNSVMENLYELDNVEVWCPTDKNQIIGVIKKSDEEINRSMNEANGLKRRNNTSSKNAGGDNKSRFKSSANKKNKNESIPNIWEGWTMDANGVINFYEIPDVENSNGLLVNSIDQIAKFGYKSIVVGFGNIMKVLYLGNDDLIFSENNSNINEEISGLSFINKRRRQFNKKNEFLNSLNFSEVEAVPGISELAL